MTSYVLLFLWPFLCIMTQHKSSSMLQHYLSLFVTVCVTRTTLCWIIPSCVLHLGCKIDSIQSVQIIERRTKTNEPVSILSLDIQVGYPWISILHTSSLDSISVNGALTSPLPSHTLSWQDTPHPVETYTLCNRIKSWNHLHIGSIVSFSDQSLRMRLPFP